ncbi:MAG: DUF58 domain-containing protein [Planctomycetota bacterium]
MALEVAEIVRRVQRIQIRANRQVDDLLAGAYRSVFKGRGMEFDEVREYTPGDEVRTIDWNVTARAGQPYVKRFAEERELTILFLVDVSRSGLFGSQAGSKLDLAMEVAALLMLSAQQNNDKIGLVLFADSIKGYFPPRKGRAATRRLIRELVACDPTDHAPKSDATTDLAGALQFVRRVQRRKAVVFVISDFLDPGWERALRIANSRHDVIAITVRDPRELEIPTVGFVTFEDPETGRIVEVDTRHPRVRALFAQRAEARKAALESSFRKSGVDELAVRTDQPYTASLNRFFRMRERRAAR